jgi:hypothetical protein
MTKPECKGKVIPARGKPNGNFCWQQNEIYEPFPKIIGPTAIAVYAKSTRKRRAMIRISKLRCENLLSIWSESCDGGSRAQGARALGGGPVEGCGWQSTNMSLKRARDLFCGVMDDLKDNIVDPCRPQLSI